MTPEPTRVDTTTYVNKALSFSMKFPEEWYLPAKDDEDPHFYGTEECTRHDKITCLAMEVQQRDYGNGPKAFFKTADSDGLHPLVRPNRVKGAAVIRTDIEDGIEGWSFAYHVFFPKEKRRFVVYTNDQGLAHSILPTMALTR